MTDVAIKSKTNEVRFRIQKSGARDSIGNQDSEILNREGGDKANGKD
jgi:hypothetical protein